MKKRGRIGAMMCAGLLSPRESMPMWSARQAISQLLEAMNPTDVAKKTEAGAKAIQMRDKTLSPRQRTLLIMVDGVKPLQALSQVCTSLQEAMDMMAALHSAGLIEVVSPPVLTAVVRPPALAPKPEPPPTSDIRPDIRRATRALEDLLGPACEPLALQLEKCKTMEELIAKIQDFRQVVAGMRSEKKAAEFVARALGTLP